ncbi:YoaK family protein [Psychrobacter phenylpyruvicus]|uniref:Predicted membrane protein n=1 Tax=Psychrobacter phenylpyruvicus TaxID=29432 RepID=A0A379LLI2_9GAMM|nr:YoaK family protein [Psychrobacter phenylpyruvicus]SUD90642.1 Predicted membrane protein [Psychrobacter phenylpyruvicus]
MITKLPLWILIGGAVLAFSAGCVNIIALSGFTNLSVSHVTGNVSLFSSAIARFDWSAIFFIGASLLSFLAGSILSGYLIGQRSLKLGRSYGLALFIEASLLFCSFLLFFQHVYWGQLLAAMACGLQNSMVATYSGAVIRTTHLTGLTSDMGAAIGNWLAGRPVNKMMLGFQTIIWYSFCGGGVVGAFGYFALGYTAMLIPVGIVLIAAFLYQITSNRLPEIREE